MTTAIGGLSSPTFPSMAFAKAVGAFLKTGAVTHTPSTTAPAARASGTATATSGTATTTIPFTFPAAAQAGDFMLVSITTAGANLMTQSADSGWVIYVYGYTYLCWRVLTAADITAGSYTFHLSSSSTWALAACAYTGVDPAFPISANSGNTATTATTPTFTAQTVHEANSLFVTAWGTNSAPATAPTETTGTRRATATVATSSPMTAITEVIESTAGAATLPAFSAASGSTAYYSIDLVLNPAEAATGTIPPGGWVLAGTYQYGPDAYAIYQTPSASNNAGATWYLIIQSGLNAGNTQLYFWMAESVSVQAMTWNAVPICTNGYGPAGPYTYGTGTPVPNSIWYTTPNMIGVHYTYQQGVPVSVSVGTTNYFLAANKDGFFFSLLVAGAQGNVGYFGDFTSLVTNPAFTDSVCLGVFPFNGAATSGGGSAYGYNSTTRDVGQTNLGWFGVYYTTPFWPSGPSQAQGVVNGSMTNNDLYQASGTTPIAQRFLMYKPNIPNPNVGGQIRGLLPSWIQTVAQTGAAWGDTVTESSDSLTLVFPGAYLWVDTTAA